jgi:hypothetical protein
MKLSKTIATAALILSIGSIANAGTLRKAVNSAYDTSDVNSSIHCVIKDVVFLAKSSADCTKAGGTVGDAYNN